MSTKQNILSLVFSLVIFTLVLLLCASDNSSSPTKPGLAAPLEQARTLDPETRLDLGHSSTPSITKYIGEYDRTVTVDMNRTITVLSLGIMFQIGETTDLIVTIRPVSGTTRGSILATESIAVSPGPLAFYEVPIDFTFLSGQRYDIAFNVTKGWGNPSLHDVEFYYFNNPTLNPGLGYDAGAFKVLDGGAFPDGGGYVNYVMPHIGAIPSPRPPLTIDIKPGSCPNPLSVKSKGVIPVAILGRADFDVTAIDVSTITLEGVTPVRSNFEDVSSPVEDGQECECTTEGPDGFLDLTLKFDKQEILAALEGKLGDLNAIENKTEIPLRLTAMLIDEEVEDEGTDCIRILNKGKTAN